MTGIVPPRRWICRWLKRKSLLRAKEYLCAVLGHMIIEQAMCIYFQDSDSGGIDLPNIHSEHWRTIQSVQYFLVTYAAFVSCLQETDNCWRSGEPLP